MAIPLITIMVMPHKMKGGCIMKKVMVFVAAFMLMFSTLVFAGGDQNHGDNGSGSTGSGGGGDTTQNHGG